MISANTLIFILGGLSFLFVFSWFKKAAIAVFEKELASSVNQKSVWPKLFQVFLVDWLVCVVGFFGTGFLFVAIFNQLQYQFLYKLVSLSI